MQFRLSANLFRQAAEILNFRFAWRTSEIKCGETAAGLTREETEKPKDKVAVVTSTSIELSAVAVIFRVFSVSDEARVKINAGLEQLWRQQNKLKKTKVPNKVQITVRLELNAASTALTILRIKVLEFI